MTSTTQDITYSNLSVSGEENTTDGQSRNQSTTPFVRYSSGRQEPILRHISDLIPEDTGFASPIYFLNESEIEFLEERRSNPYAVTETCVAKHLQDNAEKEGRVRYPIYIESDAEVDLDAQIEWLKKFCRNKLNVEPSSCKWYYSGNRSIHVHVPKLATETTREAIKALSEEFEHDIDSQIYSRKRQFRLPGAKHVQTGFRKIPIEIGWNHDEIIRHAAQTELQAPDTFEEVLRNTFGRGIVETPDRYLWKPQSDCESHIEPGLNDWEQHTFNMDSNTFQKWKSHYGSVVSPYANSGGGKRSLLIADVLDGAFTEKRESYFEGREKQIDRLLPCYIWRFWGCDREYTTEIDSRPVKISKEDYQKIADLGIEPGDKIALIGGQSRSSRIFKLDEAEFWPVAGVEERKEAIETLECFSYDTGESSSVDPTHRFKKSKSENKDTQAYQIQRKAERNGIETLTHDERRIALLRLLSANGISGTRDWFKEQYGEDYDPDLTNRHIKSACDRFEWLPEYTTTHSNVTRCSI